MPKFIANVVFSVGVAVALMQYQSVDASAADTVLDWTGRNTTTQNNDFSVLSALAVGGQFQGVVNFANDPTQSAQFFLSDPTLTDFLDYNTDLHMTGTVTLNAPVSEDFNWFFGWYDSADTRHRVGIGLSQSPNQQNGFVRADFGVATTSGPNFFDHPSLDGSTSTANGNQDIRSGTYQFSFNYLPGAFGGDINFSIGPYHFDADLPASQDRSVLDSFGLMQQSTSVANPSITLDAIFQNITYTGGSPLVAGDVNGDGIVNSQDIALIASNFLATGPGAPGDANGDGIVNAQDIALVSSDFLLTSRGGIGRSASVPEPTTFVLFALATFAVLARRRAANSFFPNS